MRRTAPLWGSGPVAASDVGVEHQRAVALQAQAIGVVPAEDRAARARLGAEIEDERVRLAEEPHARRIVDEQVRRLAVEREHRPAGPVLHSHAGPHAHVARHVGLVAAAAGQVQAEEVVLGEVGVGSAMRYVSRSAS